MSTGSHLRNAMEWYVVQTRYIHGIFSSLGSLIGNEYQMGENCLASLGKILTCLANEDRTARNFRRALGVTQVIQMDLIPLLIHATDDMKILDATIRLLVDLTLPVECLISLESLSQTECGRKTISDLNNLLISVKQAFVDPRATLCLVQRMRSAIDKGGKLEAEECESIGNCLLLLRNILHIPENKGCKPPHGKPCQLPFDSNGNEVTTVSSNQNLILWNLFAQNFDKVLLHLMTCPQRAEWDFPMVELVALTFKDQHVASLLKMLHLWLETSMSSESSEDHETSTSPQPTNQDSENSSPILTSEAASDSSDNEGAATRGKAPQKGERTKGILTEKERVGCIVSSCTVGSPNDKQKDRQIGRTLLQSNAIGKEEITQKNEKAEEDDRRFEEEDKNKAINGSEDVKERVEVEVEDEGADKDSGVFSQTANHNHSSEKKSHSSSCQRHHHHQHRTRRHHHRSHTHLHVNGKKDLASAASTTTSSPSKGMAATISKLSDCGYSTQLENQPESLSTSSNDEGPITKSANFKALQHHLPTDDDISNLLKEFALDFLFQGYCPLVAGLHRKLISSCTHQPPEVQTSSPPPLFHSSPSLLASSTLHSLPPVLPPTSIDTSHFFWLITFFLRFSSQLELEVEHIRMVLSYEILSYLVFEGVGLCEEMELAIYHCQESDIKSCLRRVHLVVTAIREFVQAVESYGKMAMTIPGREGDRPYLQMLQKQMAATRDLRCLFVLLLQHYNPSVMSKQYLQDIVVTNHVLLLFLEGGGGVNCSNCDRAKNNGRNNSLIEEVDMMDHITHFANGGIVQQYGHLLAAFQENGEYVNDCVFTMLHHIGGGEVNCPEKLFQPTLLRAFSAMWEADFDLCDDWSDLIEYIIYKFISNPQQGMIQKNIVIGKSSVSVPLPGDLLVTKEEKAESLVNTWTVEEIRNLRWFYVQSHKDKNVLSEIVKLYHQKSGVIKSHIEVLNQLLSQKIIDSRQYASLKSAELLGDASDDFTCTTIPVNLSNKLNEIGTWEEKEPKDIAKLAVSLVSEGFEKEVQWLQEALLEVCYVKLCMKKQREGFTHDSPQFPVMEPVPYHYALMGQPIPIIPWGVEEQCAVIENTSFGHLLHCLGIQKPREDGIGGIYPRIPNSFMPLDLLEAAKKLGDLTRGGVKFDPAELIKLEKGEEEERGEYSKALPCTLHHPPNTNSPSRFQPHNISPLNQRDRGCKKIH